MGQHGSQDSYRLYDLHVARWKAERLRQAAEREQKLVVGLTVEQLIEQYLMRCAKWYKKDGQVTSQQGVIKSSLKAPRELYGPMEAVHFNAHCLKMCRESWVERGLKRSECNRRTLIVRQLFSWAVGEGLIPASVLPTIGRDAVKPLQRGRCDAPESPPSKTVPGEHLEAVLAEVPGIIGDVLRLLRLTGARPGEILGLTVDQVDRTDEVWVARLDSHKESHLGKRRAIYFGPRARPILAAYVDASPKGLIFPIKVSVLRDAVALACKRATVPYWTPRQLRHTAATEIDARFGAEAASVVLGHASPRMTETYIRRSEQRGRDVATAIG